MRQVQPQGIVTGQAERTGTAENGVEHSELVCDLNRPAEEYVGDDAEWRSAAVLGGEVGDELTERGLEGDGGFDEAEDEIWGQDVGVLGPGREVVVRAVEGDLKEANGRGGWERLLEFDDVEWGVHKDYIVASLLYLES